MSELGDYQRTTARDVEADTERLRLEIERLTRERDEANASVDAQREEIARMVKECDGLRAKLRVAKDKTAGGTFSLEEAGP